jgi:endoglucanase
VNALNRKVLPFAILMAVLACASLTALPDAVKEPKYGQLKVVGPKLCDSTGKPVQLKGMSTMGLQWFGGVVNADAFDVLAGDWKVDVLRLALYVGEGGYASKPELKDLVIKGIDLAIERGLYVIVDWHVLNPGNPNDPVYSGAQDFFREISALYGKYPHVMYEIMNEPNGAVTWKNDLKPYALKTVKTIRDNDPDNIILIGSGTWSQDVDAAASDPVPGDNLMYTLHFYAGSHGFFLRFKAQSAMQKGAAVFCSEWGTSEASGNGGPFLKDSDAWLSFLEDNGISWVNWSLCDKNETSAAFKPGAFKGNPSYAPTEKGQDGTNAWAAKDLSISGAYVRSKIRGDAQ